MSQVEKRSGDCGRALEVTAYRCTGCGVLRLYAEQTSERSRWG